MLGRLLRILIGFAVACFVAGLTMVLFVFTPGEIAGLPPDVMGDRVTKGLELAIYVGVHAALFAAPLALAAAVLGEALRARDWSYWVVVGLLIAGLGLYAQHSAEQPGQPTIVNNYAVTAFLTAGFMGGLFYWLFSGRLAGGRMLEPVKTAVAPQAAPAPTTTAKPVATPAATPAGTPAPAAKPAAPAAPAATAVPAKPAAAPPQASSPAAPKPTAVPEAAKPATPTPVAKPAPAATPPAAPATPPASPAKPVAATPEAAATPKASPPATPDPAKKS